MILVKASRVNELRLRSLTYNAAKIKSVNTSVGIMFTKFKVTRHNHFDVRHANNGMERLIN